MTKTLILNVKKEYFDQIKTGTKKDEYRLDSHYWQKRLIGKFFDQVEIRLGYPKNGDMERIMVFDWDIWRRQTIKHPHFGDGFVDVFAISLRNPVTTTLAQGEK